MTALRTGETFATAGRTVSEADIQLFAGLVGDFTPIHMDEAFARTTVHGGRIAHGPLALATAIGLFTQLGLLGPRVIALLNLNWDFVAPVRIGDTIHAAVTIESRRASSRPGRDVCVFGFEVMTHPRTVVQRGRMTVLLSADDDQASQSR